MPKITITTLLTRAFVIVFLIITPNSASAMAPSLPASTLSKVEISEIFPNPKGKDKGNEWVELYNNSKNNIDLLGWKLNNGGKKDVTIKNSLMIGAESYLVLEKENLKLALKNTKGQLKLIDPAGNLIDKIDYGKAEEGKSFSKISFKTATATAGKSKWSWSDPTKKQENEIFYALEGEIISGPSQINKNWQIKITMANKTLTLKIPENQNLLLLTTILKSKTVAQFLVDKHGIIQDFKIKNLTKLPSGKNQKAEEWIKYYLIILIGLGIFGLQLIRESRK